MTEELYRMAPDRKKIGFVFEASGVRPLQGSSPTVEDILEEFRPTGSLGRGNCVYMRRTPEFSKAGIQFDQGFIHKVAPSGPVARRDIYWIGVLQRRYPKLGRHYDNLEPMLSDEDVAKNYWSGEPSCAPYWEYVAERATVIEASSTLQTVNPNLPSI